MSRYLFAIFICVSLCVSNSLFGKNILDDFEKIIPQEQIFEKIQNVAKKIDEKYKNQEIVILSVLKGSLCITTDLIRALNVKNEIEFIRAISYSVEKRGGLKVEGLERLDLENKNVLIVDDIFDSGVTLSTIVDAIKLKKPKSLESFVVLKKDVKHLTKYRPTYTLFDIENRFIIGYGLDYDQFYRGLKDVYAKKIVK